MPSRRVSGWPIFEPCRRLAGAWMRLMISGVMKHSGNGRERGSRKRGNALRRSGCRRYQGTHDDPPREFDLEAIVSGRLCVSECCLCRVKEGDGVGMAAGKMLFRRAGSPRLGGDTAERETRIPDDTLFNP